MARQFHSVCGIHGESGDEPTNGEKTADALEQKGNPLAAASPIESPQCGMIAYFLPMVFRI